MSFNSKFEDMQHKINVMALQALDKLQEGDFDAFNTDWEEANRCRLNLQGYIESEAGITEMKYGQNINFGVIMNVLLENFSNKVHSGDKKGIKSFKEMINEIKQDKILKEQFDIYNTFTNKDVWEGRNPELTRQYVDEISLACEKINRKDAKKHNLKLVEMLRKNNLDENIYIDDSLLKLYESIENILFLKNNMKDVDKLTEAKQNITDYLQENIIQENVSKIDFDTKLSEIAEKYEKELNDDEKQLIEKIENCEDKEKLFNEYKTNTISIISENINNYDGEDKTELEVIVEKLNNKKYDEKNILTDVAEMIEIANIINED